MTELKTVRLYGKLGAKFGREFKLAVSSCSEAISALCAIVPGFRKYLLESKDSGVAYTCFVGKSNLSVETLDAPAGKEDIRIAPVMLGAKKGGLFQIIVGTLLVVASLYFPPMAKLLAAKGLTATVVGLGMSLAIGGAIQMLTPQPKGLSTRDGPDNGASYNFNGPVNTTAQGNPVPLLYGRLIVGSATISAGLYAEDKQ